MHTLTYSSIRVKIIFLLFIGTASISSLFSYYNHSVKKAYMTHELEKDVDRKITRLSQNLVIPLWEIDTQWIDMIADTEMLDEVVSAMIITGEDNLKICKKRSTNEEIINLCASEKEETPFISRSLKVLHDDKEIGTVTVHISDHQLNNALFENFISNFAITLLIIIFLSIALYLALNIYILNPLKKILDVVQSATNNDYTQKVDIRQNDEIGELAHGFNTMINSILDKEEMLISQSRQAAMGEMISMIAHQWRQPITVIAMGANNLLINVELENSDPETITNTANKILEQTVHLSKTIDDFRNFFSPNKHKELVLVNDVIEENFEVIGKSLENNNIALKKEYNSATPIFIYSRELMQVFINILKNAKEALVENKIKNPTITVSTKEDVNNVYISICNNGTTIPGDILLKIFDPYFTTKDEKNGTGLGLYMSKTIVEKHLHGSINAENQKNGGVCFNITLPKETDTNE
ncbi:HAMP domain-containing histidine kinase [bacterium]|nr:HAMP domain-containing histidine kinase [bacterium]MBU1435390.1 HAMP domain-containing histidine kinase [bacterium]MBU1502299.1 HAMP domain-containing histidine kinase [bacterium]